MIHQEGRKKEQYCLGAGAGFRSDGARQETAQEPVEAPQYRGVRCGVRVEGSLYIFHTSRGNLSPFLCFVSLSLILSFCHSVSVCLSQFIIVSDLSISHKRRV